MVDSHSSESTASLDQVQRLERRLAREIGARKEAERLLEQKSLELFALNRNLAQLNASLEQRVQERTLELDRERHRAQEQAYRDPLTGLANRLVLQKHLQQAACSGEASSNVAVLYLDLDGFKAVNDSLGHPIGDELLCAVSARLRQCVRESDLVARIGGDEFVVLQMEAPQPRAGTDLAERLIRAVQAPFSIQSHQILIGTSIGIATASTASAEANSMLRDADIALYVAKAEGRGIWRAFEPEMNQQMQVRRHLEIALRCAVAEKEFEVFYQPLVQADTGDLMGFEALLRWSHPERGSISPAEFIPLAEETLLIKPLGAWVLEKACCDAARWPAPLKVAINLSPVQFVKGRLVDEVRHALSISGLDAARLELEITESVLLQNSDETLRLLKDLRDLGVQIAMDDFGTGYSSLSYLRSFPFDKIKIDRAFVQNLADGNGSLEIIRAVIGLGRALNMKVLAEGVETTEQFAALQAEGCDEVQGYLFSKPVALKDAWRTIANDQDRRSMLRSQHVFPQNLCLEGSVGAT
ncbi:putative bifunctional diguanylate cyclase/phosphodiesterase [Muricoccus aerilatus]|uniref:putative bifunctional diguanylate cyclase/phosphodiesterase n=1 Tax=Muricoccus aerilatus TaxID=452982 RepID=UPI000A031AB0|nr:EAL domain-containing protein [Roseomonas aerilata]